MYSDGTFKCCPKFFTQLCIIHGYKIGHYVPLVYALLPNKTETCYTDMLNLLLKCSTWQGLALTPDGVNIDFEVASINAFRDSFPAVTVTCCQFHLGQRWFRKIQKVGLTTGYKDTGSEIGRWLNNFFGLSFHKPGVR